MSLQRQKVEITLSHPKKRVFLDLDHTLYNTEALMALVQADLEHLGAKKEDILQIQVQLNTSGYSFEDHLRLLGFSADLIAERSRRYKRLLRDGDRFLFPGVRNGMQEIQRIASCHLLTFGLPRYQRSKMRGISCFQGMFAAEHYVWLHRTKGDIVRRYSRNTKTFFVDDSAVQLEDVHQKAPWVTCVQMTWPQKVKQRPADNNRWRVCCTFEELLTLIQGENE